MVSPVVQENEFKKEKVYNLPPGDYHIITWDADTTGRRITDEICQIAAYTPTNSFSQYVMPYGDVNPTARRKHSIRVVTMGRFRMLRDVKSGKVLKTKSDVSALTDFIQWLEAGWGKSGDGVILVCHEPHKVLVPLLLEALCKFNLLDRFATIVKGFANSWWVAEMKCVDAMRSLSLRSLSGVLLDKDDDMSSATVRACMTFQLVQHLCASEDRQGSGDGSETAVVGLGEALREYALTIKQEKEQLDESKIILERQNSLRPMFGKLLTKDRQRALNLRKTLAEAGVDYELVSKTHKEKGVDCVTELVTNRLTLAKPKDLERLKVFLQEHFNPQPNLAASENKPQKSKSTVKSNGGDASGSSTPDTTTSSPVKAASSPQREEPLPPRNPRKHSSSEPETTAPTSPTTTIPVSPTTSPLTTPTTPNNTAESVVGT